MENQVWRNIETEFYCVNLCSRKSTSIRVLLYTKFSGIPDKSYSTSRQGCKHDLIIGELRHCSLTQ